jgi:hypothetical protein
VALPTQLVEKCLGLVGLVDLHFVGPDSVPYWLVDCFVPLEDLVDLEGLVQVDSVVLVRFAEG